MIACALAWVAACADGPVASSDAAAAVGDAGAPVDDDAGGTSSRDGGTLPDSGARAGHDDARAADDDAAEPGPALDATGGEDRAIADGGEARDGGTAPDGGARAPDAGPAEDCTRYPFSADVLRGELIGFGANTTGGNPRTVYRVTSRANAGPGTLRDALESTVSRYVVFDVEGEFRLTTRIRVGSRKTVDGRGRDVRIVGEEGVFDLPPGTTHVILADLDLSMDHPADNSGDVISVRGHGGATPADFDSRELWFHHLALHYGGDGLLDIRGGTHVTISWCHLYYHTKALLHQADTDDQLVPGMHITYHHNFFDTLTRRGPHFAAGKADFFNNYQYHWYEYGAASVDEAQFLSENNIYEARPGRFCIPSCPDPSPHGGANDFQVSKVALSTDWAVRNTAGFSRSSGDLLENDAEVSVNQPGRVFQRATYYPATPEVADQALKQRIRSGAGPRVDYCR